MSTDSEDIPDLVFSDLSEITLRIPGEHFFCESITLPESLIKEVDDNEKESIENFIIDVLENRSFSPYPSNQLVWGYYGSVSDGEVLIFACPIIKLKNLGWQNLDAFRRVFPSFISLFGLTFSKATALFLLHEETLSIVAFGENCGVPRHIFSMPVEDENPESLEASRGKLLSLIDLEKYEIIQGILVAGDVNRQKDGFFKFEHEWKNGTSNHFDEDILLDGEILWQADLRSQEFTKSETKRRKQSRQKWKATLFWGLGVAALIILFLGTKIFEVKLKDKQILVNQMAAEIPLVLESQKLLEKLRQNKLGGIDPFGSINRLYPFLGGTEGNLDVWFTSAHFESRSDIEIKGEGKNVQLINRFLENIKIKNVATLQLDRSGKVRRQIKSAAGKHTFEVDISLSEEAEEASPATGSTNDNSEVKQG